jgi:polysaccharide deacetylase family protein (PEP-CTERM system associated)
MSVAGPGSSLGHNATTRGTVCNAMTVDVEDYFQVSAFRRVIRYQDWDGMQSRVEKNTQKVLDLLAEFNVHGTFFILGWVAERFPALVRRIQEGGHELGCHSYAHRLIYELTPEEFRADTQRALDAIQDATGSPVRAYRAPSFSITPRSAWAIEVLLELGFVIDSSVFPIRHDLYGFSGAPRQPFRIGVNGSSLTEFPPPALTVGSWSFPVTGGGYLRLLPLSFQLQALKAMERRGESFLVYVHPWEFDPEQPRIVAPLRSRLRHYSRLSHTHSRLRLLLRRFRFGKLSETLGCVSPLPEFKLTDQPGSQEMVALERAQ